MRRRTLAALAIAVALVAAARAEAADAAAGAKASAAAGGGEGEGEVEGAGEAKEYVFLTGLDFSYWAADKGPSLGGPGLTVGFVLVPGHLEMGVAVGAMLGGHQYTIPVEVSLTVPFYVAPWFAPYVELGPTILTDKVHDKTVYDVAAAFSAGLEFLPVGFDWGVYVSGDYNVRTLQEVRHQGGFTVGFHYRV
jgi:hypothetical protein